MQDHEERGRQLCRQPRHQVLQRFDAARRCTHYHDVAEDLLGALLRIFGGRIHTHRLDPAPSPEKAEKAISEAISDPISV